jgi:hypothetical protein
MMMNNETRKKALELCNAMAEKINDNLARDKDLICALEVANFTEELQSLLQNEEEEGGEVVLCNHEISCPSCTVIFSWKGICDKPKECICGQKLIWPKEKEGEG